jgi:hypothetical protein
MRDILEAMHDYPDEALGLCFFLMWLSGYCQVYLRKKMNDKLDEILDLLRSQNEMIKDIHDYVKEVTSEKYIGESRMTNFSINLAADILTEAISPKIKGMMVDLLKKQGWKTE